MTIYNINFGIGWASSGVEYAQAYRAKLLRNFKHPLKFVFIDLIQNENIQTYTENMGFQDDEVIWLYQYFSDIPIAPTTYTVQDLLDTVENKVVRTEQAGKVRRLFMPGDQNFITCYLKDENSEIINRAEFVVNGNLIRKDFYSYTRVYSEFYAPFEQRAKIYLCQFYNQDGSIAYQEFIDGERHMYSFKDAKFYSKEAFVAYFMKQLALSSDDVVILDRASHELHIGQAVLQHKGDSKLGVVVHAEHFSEGSTNEETILWNNYYEYQFRNAPEFDFFITATDLQNEILTKQMQQYQNHTPNVHTIPVGSLHALSYPEKGKTRRPYSIISASRLASEKHVDWLIRGVVKAKAMIPEITFDVYGEGGERNALQDLIRELGAEDYIQLHGHVNLAKIYPQYDLFVSGSTSEGFGLTLMEAVGAGLGMIGFDVKYGNPTFIEHGGNGYLIPLDLKQDRLDEITDRIAARIVDYFQGNTEDFHHKSYEIAEAFKTSHIQEKWRDLIGEVLND